MEHDVGQVEAMRGRHMPQFRLTFGKRDVQAALSPPGAFQKKLHRQRRFARARIAFNQI